MLSLLTNLNAVLLSAGQVQTDVEDARDVLARAAALSMATATAAGPDRAAQMVSAALTALPRHRLGPRHAGAAQYSWLSLISRADTPLAMTELDTITHTLRVELGEEMHLVFGHDVADDAAAPELRP